MKNRMHVAAICLVEWASVVGIAVMLAGCNRAHSKAAVQAAIDAHLKERPGLALANMTTDVRDVKFDGDRATAQVAFQSKQVPELKVEVRYVLRREGDRWVVESSTPVGRMGEDLHSAGGASSANEGPGPPRSVPTAPPAKLSPQASH